jgi:hypothetical protein
MASRWFLTLAGILDWKGQSVQQERRVVVFFTMYSFRSDDEDDGAPRKEVIKFDIKKKQKQGYVGGSGSF